MSPQISHCLYAGVEKLCKDLKVDPTDRLVLLLAWKASRLLPASLPLPLCHACTCLHACSPGAALVLHTYACPSFWLQMGAQKMGYFSRSEFKLGLTELGATTIPQLRKVLPNLQVEVAVPDALEEFHKFAFRFCLTVS